MSGTGNNQLVSLENPSDAAGESALVIEYKKHFGHVAHAGEEIRIPPDVSLYEALQQRHLLVQPSMPSGMGVNLVQEGELGRAMFNGSPKFLAPGRHTFWSPVKHIVSIVPITEKLIELGNYQIVTINQGELGLSRKNGETILLDPGRYILKAPHKFEKSTAANAQYIELGTYRRITVPAGFVAIAFDQGKQIVIRPEDTKDGPFETNSSTFLFDARNGFQPIQLQVKELDELKVNTRDGITITARGLITYKIHDPRAAFMAVQDIHGAVKRGAEATLTSLFLNATIDEIAPPLPSKPGGGFLPSAAIAAAAATAVGDAAVVDDLRAKASVGGGKGKGKVGDDSRPDVLEGFGADRADFSRHVRDSFLHDFSRKVHEWGIELKDLNIEKLEFDQNVKDLLRKRAQARLETATNLANMYAQTEVAIQQADRERRQAQIRADADAVSLKTRADAEFYAADRRAAAARLLSDVPLAAQLEIKRLDVEIVRATGDKTTFLPLGITISDMAVQPQKGQMFWASSGGRGVGNGVANGGAQA